MRAVLAACLLTVACALHAEGDPAPAMRAAAQNVLAALPKALLKTVLSATGYRKVVNIIQLEIVLRELELFGLLRDPEKYHLTFFGP